MTLRTVSSALLLLSLSACTGAWRQEATANVTGCPVADVVTRDHHSGALSNTWSAQCGGRTFNCSMPATEDQAPTTCTALDGKPVRMAAPAAAPSASAPDTIETKLRTLKQLLDQGLITPAEYETKKKALLDTF